MKGSLGLSTEPWLVLRTSGCLPQVGADKASETKTPNFARTQKQVSPGWVTHCDSSFSLGTVTPVPASAAWFWAWPLIFPVVQRDPRRAPQPSHSFSLQEAPAMALQRLVELTASKVASVRSLRFQYRLIRKLGSGSYGRVLLAQPCQGGEFSHQGWTSHSPIMSHL